MKPGVKVFKNSSGYTRYQPIIQLDDGTCLEYMKVVYPFMPSATSPNEWVEDGVDRSTKDKVYTPGLYVSHQRALTTSKSRVKVLTNIQNTTEAEREFKLVDRIWEDR